MVAGAGVQQHAHGRGDVSDMDISDGTVSVTVRIQADLLSSDAKPHVVRLIRVRLGAQKLAVELLGRSDLLDRVDECLESVAHGTPSTDGRDELVAGDEL